MKSGKVSQSSIDFDSGDDAFTSEKFSYRDPVLRFLANGFIEENGAADVFAQALCRQNILSIGLSIFQVVLYAMGREPFSHCGDALIDSE
ncbi:hypothetical protein N8787_04990 [Opitutaceae bacterium]|nr:hypothetical protein [Opitutaceae bacterium]